MTLASALLDFTARPAELLVRRWNWKAALTSSVVRGIVFFMANIASGWRAALGAMAAEFAYRGLASGFYGAMTQHISEVEPEWQAAVCAMLLLPLLSHSIEFLVHWLRGTPHLRASIIASVSFTAVSTLFNSYAMRRGAFVVGDKAVSIATDLATTPRIIAGFIAAGPLWVWRLLQCPDQ